MLTAVIMMGGLGLFVGLCLAVASKVFYVYVDPKIVAVEDALPGANCGGCGLPGCGANAEAIVDGKASPASCVAGGPELAFAIAEIMGVSVEVKEPDIARPGCYYGVADADQKYIYSGLNDCRAVAILGGGQKICTIGCLGLGTCERTCPFHAISMGPDGLPVVDEFRCTGCGACERACPKHIINLSSVTRRILREYTTDECTTPCQRACPAGINIREYIHQIERGNYSQAVQVIKERNPFPAVIGRICPRPCEQECRRKFVDEAVAINFLKRYAADKEKESGRTILPFKAPATGRKIAVVGGGVEGLSAAYFAARIGHSPTVFEATPKLGGLLRYAIAQCRLSQDILDQDIAGILEMGVEVRTGHALGRDFSIDALFEQGFEAVFIASGGWDSRLLRGKGAAVQEPIPGIALILDVVNPEPAGNRNFSCGSNVVIAGGGRLALDAARICIESGAKKVTLLFRESIENSVLTDEDAAALDPGAVSLVFDAAIGHLYGTEKTLSEIEYVNPSNSMAARLPADTLILASGRLPELILTRSETDENREDDQGPLRWEATIPYKRPDQIEEVGFFSQGDVMSDYSAAIKAIAAGRRAAASIHQIMYGIPLTLPEHLITPKSVLQDVDHVENVQACSRQIMPLAAVSELDAGGELEKGFGREAARAEAARCLQCGLICYERVSSDSENDLAAATG